MRLSSMGADEAGSDASEQASASATQERIPEGASDTETIDSPEKPGGRSSSDCQRASDCEGARNGIAFNQPNIRRRR